MTQFRRRVKWNEHLSLNAYHFHPNAYIKNIQMKTPIFFIMNVGRYNLSKNTYALHKNQINWNTPWNNMGAFIYKLYYKMSCYYSDSNRSQVIQASSIRKFDKQIIYHGDLCLLDVLACWHFLRNHFMVEMFCKYFVCNYLNSSFLMMEGEVLLLLFFTRILIR